MTIIITYHSGYGNTKIVAEHIQKGVLRESEQVQLVSTLEAQDNFELLHQAETIVFGSPTYMGTVSADFKKFMEATEHFLNAQKWKDKLAAGFTNSSTTNGDKLNTLQQLLLFASQHSMLWISAGNLTRSENRKELDYTNGLTSYLGLMTLSDNSTKKVNHLRGLATAELFGERIAQITNNYKQSK